MNERDTVIQFTRGVMDRLREYAGISSMPEVGVWRTEKNKWVFDGGHFSATVTPIKYLHFKDRVYYRVSVTGEKDFGVYETFEIAQDVAESAVATFLRGTLMGRFGKEPTEVK